MKNIVLKHSSICSPFLPNKHFYDIAFDIAKDVLKHPYVIQPIISGIFIKVLIQFVQAPLETCEVQNIAMNALSVRSESSFVTAYSERVVNFAPSVVDKKSENESESEGESQLLLDSKKESIGV
jgi:hypothetical protein